MLPRGVDREHEVAALARHRCARSSARRPGASPAWPGRPSRAGRPGAAHHHPHLVRAEPGRVAGQRGGRGVGSRPRGRRRRPAQRPARPGHPPGGRASVTPTSASERGPRRSTSTFALLSLKNDLGSDDAVLAELLDEAGADARCTASWCRRSRGSLSSTYDADEDVLQGDHVALHARHLGDVGDAAAAVDQTLRVDDQVEGARDLVADRLQRQVEAGRQHQRLGTGQGVARAVGVDRRQRAVVAGVHRLQHVHGLGAAALADDDPVGPHAQRVADQVADGDLTPCPRCWAGGTSSADDVLLVQLQLGRVLDGDDPLAARG